MGGMDTDKQPETEVYIDKLDAETYEPIENILIDDYSYDELKKVFSEWVVIEEGPKGVRTLIPGQDDAEGLLKWLLKEFVDLDRFSFQVGWWRYDEDYGLSHH